MIIIYFTITDWCSTEAKKKADKNQSALVMGQTGYLQMPTSGWKVSIDLLGEDSRSSQGDVDMDPEFGECTLSHCVHIYIYILTILYRRGSG